MLGWWQHWYFKVDEACGITRNIQVFKTGATSSTCVCFLCFNPLCSCCCAPDASPTGLSTAPEHTNRFLCLVPVQPADGYRADFMKLICFVDDWDSSVDYCTLCLLGGFVTWTCCVTIGINLEWICSNRKCSWRPRQQRLCILLMARTSPHI